MTSAAGANQKKSSHFQRSFLASPRLSPFPVPDADSKRGHRRGSEKESVFGESAPIVRLYRTELTTSQCLTLFPVPEPTFYTATRLALKLEAGGHYGSRGPPFCTG